MELRKYFLVIFQLMLLGAAFTDALQCYNCSSIDNFRCLTSPESLDKDIYSCSGSICTEETKDGVHFKGCSEQLQPGVLFCNNYDYCNSKSFEFDCLLCNSSENIDCKSNVSLVTTTCKSKMCFSSMDIAGSIVRGCQNCSDSNSCSSCNNAENCNNETLNLCYWCKGDDCLSPGTNTSTCLSNNKCFTKLHSDGSMERGCTIEADSSPCTDEGRCDSCSGDYCNKEILPKDRLKCFQCNETTKCEESYCSKAVDNDKCFAYAISSNQMVRGCLSDDIEIKCNASNCETCNSSSCNFWEFNERPSKLKCYQCTDCKNVTNLEAKTCQPYPFNVEEKCFIHSDNATKSVERGCYYDDIEDVGKECHSGSCKVCNQDNCNHDIVISCYDCPDCLTTTNSTSLSLCAPDESCISRIGVHKEVIRGCSSKNCSTEDSGCSTCGSDKCNYGIFPSDRLSCLQCNSSTTEDECSKGLVPMTSCSEYQEDDKCYELVEETLIRRGCSSDIETVKCSLENHCLECSKNGCNNESLKQNSSLSCVQCENCNTKVTPKEEQCSYEYFYFEVEECYTQNVTSNNETITNKGCLLSLPTRNCGEDCSVCKADGCNKYGSDYQEYPDFKCYICHGKNCTGEVEKCDPIPSTVNGGKGCYVEMREDVVIRDCISNTDKWNSSLKGTDVITCKTDSCNGFPVPNSAITAHLSTVFLIAVALFFSSEVM